MKVSAKEKIIRIFTIASFLITILSFELLYNNAEFIRAIINHTELTYNFSLFRVIIYITTFVVLLLKFKKMSNYAMQNFDIKVKKYLTIAFFIVFLLGTVYICMTKFKIQTIGIIIMTFFMTACMILYLGKSTIKNMLIFGFTFGVLFSITNFFNHAIDERQHFISALNVSFGNFNFDEPITDEKYQQWDQVLRYDQLSEEVFETYEPQITSEVEEGKEPTGSSALLYLPSGIGITLARILKGTMIDVYIAGRITNLIFYLAVAAVIIKILPFKKNLFACFMVNPMLIALAASYSLDGICSIFIMLFIAYVLKLFKEEKIGLKQIGILILLFALVLMQKSMAYAPIALIVFILPIIKIIKQNKKYIPYLIVLAIILLVSGIFLISRISIPTDTRYEGTDSSSQVSYLIENPLHLAKVFYNHTINNLLNFNWLSQLNQYAFFGTFYHIAFLILAFYYVVIAVTEDSYHFKFKNMTILIIAYLACIFTTSLALYIGVSKVGADDIDGYQARYLFPILVLPLMCLSSKNIKIVDKEWTNLKLILILGIITLIDFVGMVIM